MRLVRFRNPHETRLGALVDDDSFVVDLLAAAASLLAEKGDPLSLQEARIRLPPDVGAFLRGGRRSLELCEEALRRALAARAQGGHDLFLPRSAVRLEPPLVPRLIVCGGGNFWDHLKELGRDKPEHVEFFLKNPASVLGPEDDIPHQPWAWKKLDYEAELGIVIGKRGRCIPRDRALDHVFGYTAVNDMAIRDRQLFRWRDSDYFHVKYGDGKVFDANLVVGPSLVTADEVADPKNLSLRCRVNGEPRQNSNTSEYIWGVADVIEYYSHMITLEPGYLICPGTPGGCAVGSDPECGGRSRSRTAGSEYLQPGEVVVIEVEGVGRLENCILGTNQQNFVANAVHAEFST
jgi:acylpyruvate hydrolase